MVAEITSIVHQAEQPGDEALSAHVRGLFDLHEGVSGLLPAQIQLTNAELCLLTTMHACV